MAQADAAAETGTGRVIPDAHALAPETQAALGLFHAAGQEFTTLDPVTIDLCRLKSAYLNDCKW